MFITVPYIVAIGCIFFGSAYFLWEVILTDKTPLKILEIEDFLNDQECKQIIDFATKKGMDDSMVDNGVLVTSENIYKYDRDSKQCWIRSNEHPFVLNIQRKLKKYIDLPIYLQEAMQVVKYSPGGYFKSHYDEKISWIGHRYYRYATFLIYLNDDYTGGETFFPRIPYTVKPKKGKAILFHNISKNNHKILWYSKHEGKDVLDGQKWIANIWVRLYIH